ncbi:MAG: AAA family ATPase [Acidobacteria bacterium]|nr:AAA family ATPase [Acidobacteriota bacterium]MYH30499.1 AAA family ATPase [Acidobacteriota bacterium]
MLSSFTFENFKSYRKATLKLAPLTVLIGANASGKSNAIEALRLLCQIASGDKLAAIRHALQDKEHAVRGNVSDLGFRGERAFSISCEITEPDWNRYSIGLELRDDDELHISNERVTGPASNSPLFEVVSPSRGAPGDMFVAYNNFARGGKKPQIACSDQVTVLWQLTSPARFYHDHKRSQKEIPATTRRIHQQLSTVTLLDPRPSLMRDYSFKSEHNLTESGKNLSGVLWNLCQKKDVRDQLLEFIRALPEQDIKEIDFIPTPRDEVMIRLTETFGGSSTTYDATLLSDGTLRVLAIAAAILSSAPGNLVVIEEVDNGVHPSRAAQLLTQVSRIAKERDLRVLISSHNPALLDALPDDAVPHVVFCYRDPSDGSSRLIRLSDIPDYPELIAQGTVGHLMTHRIMERFVKERPEPGQRKIRAHAWLNELRKQVG